MEVLGLLYQRPWGRWNCYEMAVTPGEKCPWCVGLVNMVGRLLAVRHLKFAIILHTCTDGLLHTHTHTHSHTNLTETLHINSFWQGQDCDCKDVSVCRGVGVGGVNVHWMGIKSER